MNEPNEQQYHAEVMAQLEQAPLWQCVYCWRQHRSPSGTGTDVLCCGEIGHVEKDEDYEAWLDTYYEEPHAEI